MGKKLVMKVLDDTYGVCRLESNEEIPQWSKKGELFAIAKSSEELSIVCDEKYIPNKVKCEKGWRVLKVLGPLDFSLVGILSSISGILANNKISIFAISTFDTDYILVKDAELPRAIAALELEDYEILS